MIAKFFFYLGFFAAAFAQREGVEASSHLETLKASAEKMKEKVLETLERVNKSSNAYDEYIKERSESLIWVYRSQKGNFTNSITTAVTRGILKNKSFKSFHCISNGSRDTFDKFEEIYSEIPTQSEKIKNRGLENVTPFRFILSSFYDFIKSFYHTKEHEMKEATDEAERKKILEQFLGTMTDLEVILKQVNDHADKSKFKFFEEFGEYAFTTEKKIMSTRREGTKKILKCVS